MLVAGLICNYLVKPVDPKWNMSAEEVSKLLPIVNAYPVLKQFQRAHGAGEMIVQV